VLVVYLVLVGWRGVLLVRTGDPVAVALGLAVVVLPVVAAVVVVRELRFGGATQRMARELEADGGLPVDDLPRRPSGRVVREAADATFAGRRAEVEAAPEDWRAWYRLAVAYDDAGDRRRAREAMRYAVRLHGSRRA
jgi:cytochrome c-type biogenesis protein CcmH/NrfG